MDYHLKPIGKMCALSGKELVPGETCVSALVERNGEFLRVDISEEAWTGSAEGEIGHWTCIVPEPESQKNKPLDANSLMRYFEQLCEEANPAQEKFAYVLSLLLLQKRKLRIEGSRTDGEIEYLNLSGTAGEGSFEVRHQQLSEEEIEQLQISLNKHLESEWN